MRWFKPKFKPQEPWGPDFDIVQIPLSEGTVFNQVHHWFVPDNLYLHVLGMIYKLQTVGAVSFNHMWYVDHGYIRKYSYASTNAQIGSVILYWSWMPAQDYVRFNVNMPFPCQPMGENVYLFPGDQLTLLFQPNTGSPRLSDWILTCRQWRVY